MYQHQLDARREDKKWTPWRQALTGSPSASLGMSPQPGIPATGQFLLSLQGRYGNRYVQRVVDAARQGSPAAPVQAKTAEPNHTGLPDGLKAGIEALSSLSLDDVRVHYSSSKPAELQALAYTQGAEIHVAPGQERHLPHEAWHVVQQMQGRVKPTVQMKDGVRVNDDKGLEHEADVMGRKSIREMNFLRGKLDVNTGALKPPSSTMQNSVNEAAPLQFNGIAKSLKEPFGRVYSAIYPVGTVASDIGIGSVFTLGSNLSWLSGQTNTATYYSPALTGVGFATGMYAILKLNKNKWPIAGGEDAKKAPKIDAWKALSRKKTTTNGAFYVRAHLLRDKFGGKAKWENLVPLTNSGNNVGGSPISHYDAVETAIENELKNGKTIGYRVIPIYGNIPLLKLPTTIVNTFIGLIPSSDGWLKELRDILYYENYIPEAILTSWWDQTAWNPIPSIRLIRNWAPFDASFNYTIKGRNLSLKEWIVFGLVLVLTEALKVGLSYYGPFTMLLGLASKFGILLPPLEYFSMESVARWFEYINGAYPWMIRALGNFGSKDVSKEFRKGAGSHVGGLIPTVGESATLGYLGYLFYRWGIQGYST